MIAIDSRHQSRVQDQPQDLNRARVRSEEYRHQGDQWQANNWEGVVPVLQGNDDNDVSASFLECSWLICLNFLCLNVLYVRALCGCKYTLLIHHPHPYHYCDNMQERNPFGQPACSKRMLKISSYQKCICTLNIILKV